ncbi:hypothetical protein [Streptomyces albicerus]|uniref:hypothetical protein n=1 Tax=Streptomyces albicerus TaxID=2569859 RepID=UPI001788B903|nr:hypothetical protein [Streptomyces albicerus]
MPGRQASAGNVDGRLTSAEGAERRAKRAAAVVRRFRAAASAAACALAQRLAAAPFNLPAMEMWMAGGPAHSACVRR